MTLASTDADPDSVVRLEEELRRLQQLRQRILESLDAGLQGPRHQHYLRVKLRELNRSITDVRHRLSPGHPKRIAATPLDFAGKVEVCYASLAASAVYKVSIG
jgi:hypothetical protein